ncbi:MAG: hypothetical protein ABI632_10675, partial [Pseudolysinimonas sp.]
MTERTPWVEFDALVDVMPSGRNVFIIIRLEEAPTRHQLTPATIQRPEAAPCGSVGSAPSSVDSWGL